MSETNNLKQFNFFLILVFMAWLWGIYNGGIPYIKLYSKYYDKYHDKSLYEKSKSVDGDFIDFISFCSENVPKDALLFFYNGEGEELNSDAIYYRERARYYLYPNKVYYYPEKVEPKIDYVLVYEVEFESKDFEPFVKFNDHSYILVRKEKKA